MYILDIPLPPFSAAPAEPHQPIDLPALPHGELEALTRFQPLHGRVAQPSFLTTDDRRLTALSPANDPYSCQYQTSDGRPCPRPVIHYEDREQPEDYCAAHLAWLEQVEEPLDLPYPDSPQALLDLLAHTAA